MSKTDRRTDTPAQHGRQGPAEALASIPEALDRLEQGLSIFDGDLRLTYFNRAFVELLEFPEGLVVVGVPFEDLIRYNAERGEYGDGDVDILVEERVHRARNTAPHRLQRERPNGRIINIEGFPLDGGGFVTTYMDVTARVHAERRSEQAESALRRANTRTIEAIEAFPDAFALYDAEDRLVLCNEKYREFYSATAEAITPGKSFEELLRYGLERGEYQEAIGREEDWLAERMTRHRDLDGAFEQKLANGRWLLVRERKTRDGETVGVCTDITELKATEAALRQSEERFRDFAESASDWLWECGPDLRFTYLSEQFEAHSGVPASMVIGKTREEFGKPDDSDETWTAHLADLRARRPFRDFRYRSETPDGSPICFRISGVPVFDDNDAFMGYRGTGTNVVAQVLAEQQVEQAQQLLRDAIESVADGFALFDADDRLVLFNDNYRAALSVVEDLLVPGTPFETIFRALVERGNVRAPGWRMDEWIEARLEEHRAGCTTRTFETPDGRWIDVHEYPTRDGGRALIRADVTDRRQAELALLQSQKSLANAQRIASLGNWDLTVVTSEFAWSDEIYRICGLERGGARPTYDMLLDMVHPGDRATVRRALDESIHNSRTLNIDHRIVCADGSERLVHQQGEVTYAVDGTPLRMAGTMQDITARKQAESALHEANERFRLAFRTSPDAMTISRAEDGLYVDVNEGFTALTGYTRREVVGRSALDIGFWTDPGKRRQLIARLRREGRLVNEEIVLRDREGTEKTALFSGRIMTLNGEPHIFAVTKDITAIKRAADDVRKLSRAIEQAPSAVIITDTDGIIEYVNPRFSEMTGYAAEEAIGRTPRILRSDSTDDTLYENMWSTLHAGGIWNGEFRNRRNDGSSYWCGSIISPIKNPSGEVTHFVGVQEDITHRKEAEKKLRDSEERFRQLIESSVLGIVIDQRGRPVFANKTYVSIFGFDDPEDIVAMPALDGLYAPASLARVKQYRVARARGDHAPTEYEFQGVKRDGSLIWVQTHVHTIVWNGEPAVQSTVVDITLRKLYEEKLRYQANFDQITDLPNRVLALDRLKGALSSTRRHGHKVGLLFMDIDHFKKINDTHGHATGDRFLAQAAERIVECVREEDTVARLSGDEFAVVLPDIRSARDTEPVAHKILDAFSRPFILDGQEAFVGSSIGIALGPDDGDDPELLLRNADAAMYEAKEQGRHTFRYFTRELNERAVERVRIEARMRRGLDADAFEIHYQPLVEVRSGLIIGAEALVRWNDPELGAVSPEKFVPLAEDSGLIVPLGRWVLDTACKQMRAWHAEGLDHLRLTVNVSARQFRGSALVEAVAEALTDNGLPADSLELEITEGLLMDDIPETHATLHGLDRRGIRLAVDDFGTGYSSLSYLKRFPVDTLKIDKAFIRDVANDPDDVTLVEAIIAMARRLNLQVIAEGVETSDQLAFLRAQQCELAQGYLFSRPLTADAFGVLVREATVVRSAIG